MILKLSIQLIQALSQTNNSLLEFLSFDKQKKQNQINYLESFKPFNKVLVENNTRYLKTSNFLELNLTSFAK